MSFLRGLEVAETDSLSSKGYFRREAPRPAGSLRNSFQSKLVVSLSGIAAILGPVSLSEIAPSVVCSHAVAMIYVIYRITTRNYFEDDSMSWPSPFASSPPDRYADVSIGTNRTDWFSSIAPVPGYSVPLPEEVLYGACLPAQPAGIGAVIKALPKVFGRWQSTKSHVVTPVVVAWLEARSTRQRLRASLF